MNLLELPAEIVTLILQYLDVKTKINIYNSCKAMRIFFTPCLMRNVVLSRNSVACLKTLHQDFFLDLSMHIQDLNLSGIPDLTIQNIYEPMKRLQNLKSLDLTFTNIHVNHLILICPATLKNISVNFFKCPRTSKRKYEWKQCQQLFRDQKFSYVHLIVFEFSDAGLPLAFLKDMPVIPDLKITVADNYKDSWSIEDIDSSFHTNYEVQMNFHKLSYIFRDCSVTHKTADCLRGVMELDFQKMEYIFIMYLEHIVIYVSPVFMNTFHMSCSDLKVEICAHLPLNFMLDGNIIFKCWNKSKTNFDEVFFQTLMEELKDYFPTYVCMHDKTKLKIVEAPSSWYSVDSCDGFEMFLDELPEKITLNDFCRKDGAVVRCNIPLLIPLLTLKTEALRNITFLRLSNISLKNDSLSVLFSKCLKLHTLDISIEKRRRLIFRGWELALSKTINLATNLKNLKLTSEDIEYEIVFDAISSCPSLENVHICEYERVLEDEPVSEDNIYPMLKNCENLYSFFIEADLSPEHLTLLMSPMRDAAQKLQRDFLTIEVCQCYQGWNPFVDVFNPSPLHILD